MAKLSEVILRDVIGSIPAAGVEGRLFVSSDEGKFYRDNGATWDEVVFTTTAASDVEEWYGPSEAGDYLKTWDALEDRTGGTVTITLQAVPLAGSIVEVTRAGSLLRQTVDWTIVDDVITFVDGHHPILDGEGGEDVRVKYTQTP